MPYFNVHNYAKIIGTEDIVHIGSANFSNESADNIEMGILIEDRDFISKLYSEFFDKVSSGVISYLDDNHAVKSPINIGIRLFTRISTFPNPAFLNRKVQIAVSTYSVPHAAARI